MGMLQGLKKVGLKNPQKYVKHIGIKDTGQQYSVGDVITVYSDHVADILDYEIEELLPCEKEGVISLKVKFLRN